MNLISLVLNVSTKHSTFLIHLLSTAYNLASQVPTLLSLSSISMTSTCAKSVTTLSVSPSMRRPLLMTWPLLSKFLLTLRRKLKRLEAICKKTASKILNTEVSPQMCAERQNSCNRRSLTRCSQRQS
jgi:hypothetical protein